MLKPATLVLVGLASAAAIAHAFRAPFPGVGGNPVLDLIAYHDPGFHTVSVWYYSGARRRDLPPRVVPHPMLVPAPVEGREGRASSGTRATA